MIYSENFDEEYKKTEGLQKQAFESIFFNIWHIIKSLNVKVAQRENFYKVALKILMKNIE